MAFLVNDDEEDLGNEPEGGVQPPPTGQGGSFVNAQQSQGMEGGTPANQKASGSYTNLQKYVEQNRDQSAPLADKVTGEIQGQASQARTGAQNDANQFKTLVEQQATSLDRELLGKIKPGAYTPAPVGGNVNPQRGLTTTYEAPQVIRPSSEVNAASLTPEQKAQIKRAASAQYTGPTSIDDNLSEERNLARQAGELSDLSQSEPGRFELLKRTVGDPNYQRGERRLDQAILQNSPEAKQKFDQVRASVSGLPAEIDQIATTSNALVDPAKRMVDENRDFAMQGLTAAQQQYIQNLEAIANEKNAQFGSQREADINLLKSGSNSDAERIKKIVGVENPNMDAIRELLGYAPDLTQFYTDGRDATASNQMNPQEEAELAALAEMMGGTSPLQKSADLASAGKFNTQDFRRNLISRGDQYGRDSSLKNNLGVSFGERNNPMGGDTVYDPTDAFYDALSGGENQWRVLGLDPAEMAALKPNTLQGAAGFAESMKKIPTTLIQNQMSDGQLNSAFNPMLDQLEANLAAENKVRKAQGLSQITMPNSSAARNADSKISDRWNAIIKLLDSYDSVPKSIQKDLSKLSTENVNKAFEDREIGDPYAGLTPAQRQRILVRG